MEDRGRFSSPMTVATRFWHPSLLRSRNARSVEGIAITSIGRLVLVFVLIFLD